jgi:hypothetical protein
MNKKISLILIIILVVGFVIFRSKTNNDQAPTNSNNSTAGMRVEDNAIYVQEQKPGKELIANMAVLKKPGFIVIHQDNNGVPGAIIGISQYLTEGEHDNVKIILNTSTMDKQTIYAMLHEDNGDKIFSETDTPVSSVTGGPIMMIITIDSGAPEQPAITL